jgi:hypothetical protein
MVDRVMGITITAFGYLAHTTSGPVAVDRLPTTGFRPGVSLQFHGGRLTCSSYPSC